MARVTPLFPAHFTGDDVAAFYARTDEVARRRLARWHAQMDKEFPMLECPDLGVIPMGRPPTRTPPT